MDFKLSEERQMLKDTIARFVRDRYDIETRHKNADEDEGFSRDMWARFAELGVIGALLPEKAGGFGGEGEDITVVMEELGRGLVVEPFLATAILGGGIIADAGKARQKKLLESVIGGETILAFAHGEPDSRYSLSHVTTKARKSGKGYKISGNKAVVINGDAADRLIVSARVSGKAADEKGISLFLIDADAKGVTRRGYKTVDGGHAAEITLENVVVGEDALVGRAGDGFKVIERAAGRAVLALCAEAIGVMEVCRDVTLDYLKQRKQFGVPLSKFQALQHRMVELCLEIEQTRSAVVRAAGMMTAPRREREIALAAAKNLTGRAGRLVAEESIQLHGGIAMTWEYSLPHFAKRLTMIDHQFGDTDHHLERFIALTAA